MANSLGKIGSKERTETTSPELEFQCSECSFSARNKRTLKTHVLAKHRGVVRYSCSRCEFKNYRKDLVEIHIETFHSGGEEAQVLYLNSPEFAAWNYGDNRRRRSKSVGGYVKRNQTRSRQTRKLTSKPDGMFRCSECDLTTNQFGHLKDHTLAIHRQVLNYYCGLCQ